MKNKIQIFEVFFEDKEDPKASITFNEENFIRYMRSGGSHKQVTHLMAHIHRIMWVELKKPPLFKILKKWKNT